ncbi:hypothetical protein [Streptomyces sp. Ac-502]|uniref:hypothetical protein n=1 Tax=Streptomyces sp. Ac-502 TaxID=3342801 RepID=UPI0038625B3B
MVRRCRNRALHGRDVRAVWQGLLARAGRGELADLGKPGTSLSSSDLVNKIAFRKFYGPDHAGLATAIAAMEASGPLPARPPRWRRCHRRRLTCPTCCRST